MAEQLVPERPAEDPNRTAYKQRYTDKAEVRRKWLKEYGSIDEDGNYQRNKECLSQLFNLLDYVVDNALDACLQQATYLGLNELRQERWMFHAPSGDRELVFRPPTTYGNRVYALNQFLGAEHRLPKGVNKDVRDLRNDLTHINNTVMADQLRLDMDSLCQPLQDIGTALFQLGLLDRRDIVPSFDSLRVQAGSALCGGKYRVGTLIGEGGMSRVYRGHQHDGYLARDVAIKELKPDRYLKDTIRNECAVMTQLKHSHIPAVYDAFSQNGTYYIVMELIDGTGLSDYLQTHRLTDAQRDRIADGLCDVLSYLHADGRAFVYADLKPDNILVDQSGDPYLIDFGITRMQGGDKSQRYFSPKWSAPEVLAGHAADQRADVYALGMVLKEVYSQTANPSLHAVLAQCTAQNPMIRFESIPAVSRALKLCRNRPPAPIGGNAPQAAMQAPPQASAQKKNSKRKQEIFVICMAVLVILLCGVLLLLLLSPSRGASSEPSDTAAASAASETSPSYDYAPADADLSAASPGDASSGDLSTGYISTSGLGEAEPDWADAASDENVPQSTYGWWRLSSSLGDAWEYRFYGVEEPVLTVQAELHKEQDQSGNDVYFVFLHFMHNYGSTTFGYFGSLDCVTLNYEDGTQMGPYRLMMTLDDARDGTEIITLSKEDKWYRKLFVRVEQLEGLVSCSIKNIRLSDQSDQGGETFINIPIVPLNTP